MILLVGMLGVLNTIEAQEANQTMRGMVVDNDTKDPIPYVVIEILNFSPPKSATTNERGIFEVNRIPRGVYKIELRHPKYMPIIISELYVGTGEQAILKINMNRKFSKDRPRKKNNPSEEPLIIPQTALNNQTNKNNLMGLELSNTIKQVDIDRVPYTFGDPARVFAKFGSAYRRFDQTGLWIRGHHPNTIQWRIEGLPISSPNHLVIGARGTGYMPIFHVNSLKSVSLYNGMYPAEYGNALNSVMDLAMRAGNRFGVEGNIEVNAAGISGLIEGGLDKENKHSFLVGLRTGFLPLLEPLIIDRYYPLPRIHDATFNLNFRTLDTEVNVFGIGGYSELLVNRDKVLSNDRYLQYRGDVKEEKLYGVFGVSFRDDMYGQDGYYKIVLGSNYNQERFEERKGERVFDSYYAQTTATSLLGYYHHTFSKKNQVRVGGGATHHYLDHWSLNRANNRFATRAFIGHSVLAQLYAQWLVKVGDRLQMTTGIHGQYLTWNNDWSISPRFALTWDWVTNHRISLGYTWNHQMQPWEIYLNTSNQPATAGQRIDRDLKFTQNQHFFLAYEWRPVPDWQLKAEGFYQRLYHIPVYNNNADILLTNHSPGQNAWELSGYNNQGEGWHYGVELTVQKYFSRGYYGILSTTYFQAKYKSEDGVWEGKEGNHQVNANLMIGKEFKIGAKRNNNFFVEANYRYRRGDFYTAVDLEASIVAGRTVLDWTDAYGSRHPSIHHVDVRLGFELNAKKKLLVHRFFIEAHNVLNQKTAHSVGYNPRTREVEQFNYLGIVPSITYKLNFGFNPME